MYAFPELVLLHDESCLIMISYIYVGATEYKLFVGSLNKHASEKEVEEVCHLCYFIYPCVSFAFLRKELPLLCWGSGNFLFLVQFEYEIFLG